MERYSYETSQQNRRIGKVMRRMKTFHLRYQNIIMMVLSFVFTYYLVRSGLVELGVSLLGNFGYVSAAILGALFAIGFTTTPAAAGLFFLAKQLNPFLMALIAAVFAALSNLALYFIVKHRILDEIRYTLSEAFKIEVSRFEIILSHKVMKNRWVKIFVPALAGVLTSLPVPTELIAAILWNVVKYRPHIVFIYSFIFSFVGILLLGLFGAGL